ncbi:hypothetical protein [Clostridium niameyense]|uniref:hypothetical protein n=1 Tax=Clostridium niameyense TaxID=1622073 RepID=UPI00067EDF2B|nr:hypothetical protein [Clostridium niameyense]
MSKELLDAVKSYLHITWKDENTEKNLIDAINSSKARLQEIAGVPLDFNKEGLARDLLKDRCRYINSNALEMFETNFAMELLNLHIQGQVSAIGSDTNENKSG